MRIVKIDVSIIEGTSYDAEILASQALTIALPVKPADVAWTTGETIETLIRRVEQFRPVIADEPSEIPF